MVSSEYKEWERNVPKTTKRETVWTFFGYRKASFLFDLAWIDCTNLQKDFRGRSIVSQLIRSAGSIGANIEEGYGRGFIGKERLQFLRYAVGSARETKGWYLRGRHLISNEIFEQRSNLIDEVISLLVTELRKKH